MSVSRETMAARLDARFGEQLKAIDTSRDMLAYEAAADDWHGLFYMFPFDLNEGLSAEGGDQSRLDPFYNSTNSRRPALSKTLVFPDWRARYIAHYRTVVEESQS